MTTSDIDSIVVSAYRKHQFSSAGIISRFSNLSENEVESSINRLVTKGKLYQSVKGFPRRYSLRVPKATSFVDEVNDNTSN